MNNLHEEGRRTGLKVNIPKTITLVFGSTKIEKNVKLGGRDVDNVEEFVYLGSLAAWDNYCSKDFKHRIGKATGAFQCFRKVRQSKDISNPTKTKLLSVCVMSVLMYEAETSTFKKNDINRLRAFKIKCLQKILNIRWQKKSRTKRL